MTTPIWGRKTLVWLRTLPGRAPQISCTEYFVEGPNAIRRRAIDLALAGGGKHGADQLGGGCLAEQTTATQGQYDADIERLKRE